MLFLLLSISFASIANADPICSSVSNSNSVLACVREQSLQASRLSLEREATLSESSAVKRWVNPEVWNQSLFGASGQPHSEIQFGLWQIFELGSKWTYKNTMSRSLEQRAGAEYSIGLGEELRKVASDLIRLGQLKQEIASLDEATETFNRLITQFNSRPSLGPEQAVSVSVYKISKGDFWIRRNALVREQDEIQGRFRSQLQLTADQIEKIPFQGSISLPNLDAIHFPENQNSSFKILDADLASSEANLSLAKSDYFSEIKLGPVAELASDNGARTQSFGFQISLPLPLLNQNGYGISAASQKLKAAEIASRLKKAELQEEWARSLRNYSRLKTLLKEVPSPKDIASKHKKVESQIFRGLVSSALVVESHRSLIDLQKSRNEAELEAVNIWWKLLIYQGRPEDIKL